MKKRITSLHPRPVAIAAQSIVQIPAQPKTYKYRMFVKTPEFKMPMIILLNTPEEIAAIIAMKVTCGYVFEADPDNGTPNSFGLDRFYFSSIEMSRPPDCGVVIDCCDYVFNSSALGLDDLFHSEYGGYDDIAITTIDAIKADNET